MPQRKPATFNVRACVYTLSNVADAVRVRVAGHDERARVRLQDDDAVVPDAAQELGRLVERAQGLDEPLLAPDDTPEAAPAEHVRPAALLLSAVLVPALPLMSLLLLPALLQAPGALVGRPVLLAPPHASLQRALAAPALLPGGRDGRCAEEAGGEE